MIDRYLEAGDMHVLSIGDAPVCVAVVIPYSDTACELKNLATDPQFQKQGYATRLMETLFKFYAARFRAMYVGTAGPGVAFYARFGFTHSHTVAGFFTDNYPEPIYEDGVLLTDMLYLKKSWPDRKAPGKTPMDFISSTCDSSRKPSG
ncbi:MAG: GNAT family N-acetyltransferase [Bilophila wadsworthia]